MLAIAVALMMQAAAAPLAPPSPEAVAMAREVADAGVLAMLLPTMADKELTELAAERPNLTGEQHARLIATGKTIAARHREAVLQAMALSYARRLSLADLRTLAAASRTPAARAKRAADIPATMAAMAMLGPVDFKRETAVAFCAETKLFCDR